MNSPFTKSILCCTLFALSMIQVSVAGKGKKTELESTRTLAIEMGAPFHDHAVLQRDMEVPVWGWSEPGTKVTVSFAEQSVSTTTAEDGKWVIRLNPLKTSAEPAEMTITDDTGRKEILKDILVGEVWMASGQSNMQWVAGKSKVLKLAERFSSETKGQPAPIREFQVSSVTSQLHPIRKATGAWKNGNYAGYSAIAFAFAHKLYEEIEVPIGILNCSFSQTSIQSWVPREGFAGAEDEYSKAIHLKCLQTDPTTPEHKEVWDAFYKSLEEQIEANETALRNGGNAKPISASVPGNLKGNRDSNWLFNGRISPVVPYSIRGAIWNQGYANQNEGLPYYNNLHSLIRGWRTAWNQPELPVYFHQFYSATMRHPGKEDNRPRIGGPAEMRHGTWLARDIPNTGMASQIDISGGIHYAAKAVPGQRLALHALKNQYGHDDLIVDGPMYRSHTVEENKLIIEFEHADGGLLVAETGTNAFYKPPRAKKGEQPPVEDPATIGTGYADPKVIPNGADQVSLFFVAGEDRVWHPARVSIDGSRAIVSSPEVKNPRGVSYATGGVGFQPNLYNRSLLPMTPFIVYDDEFVLEETWPDERLKIAGETIDPKTTGNVHAYRKMPLLSVQFRENAVFQADQPVTIWGSTRQYGEWQSGPDKGACNVYFEFGPTTGSATATIKKTIEVTPEMAEWKVTLPPMKAGPEPHTLKVQFSIDGEIVHERVINGIVFGDVWCIVAPALDKGTNWSVPEVEPSGRIVRMIENESMRDGRAEPSRFSICTSRTPGGIGPDGKKWGNRLAACWKNAEGMAAAIGNQLSAQSERPIGIIFLEAKKDVPLKNWIAPVFLKEAPSLMEDYRLIGSQYPENPYYIENLRRYMADWKSYWGDYIPAMMKTGAIPANSKWGANWGSFPSMEPDSSSTATFEYNVYVHSFTPTALSGMVFITGKGMVEEDQGANFGPEMAALAKSFKTRLSLWSNVDIPFFYTMPSKALAPRLTKPKVRGVHTAVSVDDWTNVTDLINELAKIAHSK